MATALIWLLVALLMLLGLLGTVVPGLPDAPLILAAAVLHKIFLPRYLSPWTLAAFGLLSLASLVLNAAGSLVGARRFGATSWGLWGAALGALLGLSAGPLGAPVGAVLGAIAAELALAHRSFDQALRAGMGTGLGLLASAAGRFLLCLVMVLWFLLDCFLFR